MEYIGIDLRGHSRGRIDICDTGLLEPFVNDVTGIIHLAAVSRVTQAEQDPQSCHAVNVVATRGILNLANAARHKPWVLYASSREVYGQQDEFPVAEDAAYRAKNTYARSKAQAEHLVFAARDRGQQVAVVRFSNVYGSVDDYGDRVVPAFVEAATRGGVLRVDGSDSTLDFTHVDDVAEGVMRMVDVLLQKETKLPPIHLASGRGTTLLDLAHVANMAGGQNAMIVEGPARPYAVRIFVGNPARARALLGWTATTDLPSGMAELTNAFKIQQSRWQPSERA